VPPSISTRCPPQYCPTSNPPPPPSSSPVSPPPPQGAADAEHPPRPPNNPPPPLVCSQVDPTQAKGSADGENPYWSAWHDFEVAHGNEDTFREMLRLKRTVKNAFAGGHMYIHI